MTIVVFIIILAVLIFTHELGHFWAAKKAGVRVDEFGFGFPPKIWSFRRGETEYSINLIPIGGFVKIFGENPDEESERGSDCSRSLIYKPRYIQAVILAAGVFLNLVLAWFLLSLSFYVGMPVAISDSPTGAVVKDERLIITSILNNSPADKAGFLAGDTIIKLKNSEKKEITMPSIEETQTFIKKHADQPIEIFYSRGHGESLERGEIKVIPRNGVVGDEAGIGITMEEIGIAKLSLLRSFVVGFQYTYSLTVATVVGFGDFIVGLFTDGGQALSNVSGPIGLFGLVSNISRLGLVYLINFTAIISINLAVLNLLPFPALDGGRLLFLLIEAIKGSRLNPKIANVLNAAGFIMLLILMAVVAVSDISKLV